MIDFSLKAVVAGMILFGILALYRVIWGPHASDRILGTNVLMTNAILIIVILSHLFDNYTYLDVAFVYVLSSFVGTICVLKSLGKGKLS